MSEVRGERFWTPEWFIGVLERQVRLARDSERQPGRSAARAALAALRRGLGHGPGEVAEVDRIVQRWLDGANDRQERLAYVIAPLLAMQAQGGSVAALEDRPPHNLGASLADFRRRQRAERAAKERAEEERADRIDAVERRLLALLASRSDGLSEQLRGVVTLLKTKEVGIDWRRLWWDLWQWEDPERTTQRTWARSFWRAERADQDDGGTVDEAALEEVEEIDLDEEDEDDAA